MSATPLFYHTVHTISLNYLDRDRLIITNMFSLLQIYRCLICLTAVYSFVPAPRTSTTSSRFVIQKMAKDSEGGGLSPFKKGLNEMFASLDDTIDDFFNKRMGNGEIFYGKRKIKPSGTVEGAYNGMGLTDKQKIDETRELKAFRMEQKKKREQEN